LPLASTTVFLGHVGVDDDGATPRGSGKRDPQLLGGFVSSHTVHHCVPLI